MRRVEVSKREGIGRRFKIGAGIVKPTALRIRLRSGAPLGGFVMRPAPKSAPKLKRTPQKPTLEIFHGINYN